MDSQAITEQIVKSLSFEVKTVPYPANLAVSSIKSNPVNLRVRVRKDDDQKGLLKHGVLTVSKHGPGKESIPERVRLVSSDQTICSFNFFMEAEFDKEPPKKRKRFLSGIMPGTCFGQRAEEDEPYQPQQNEEAAPSSRTSETDLGKKALKQAAVASSTYTVTRKNKRFLGKCKPGGCLDPPYNEDKYPYERNIPTPLEFGTAANQGPVTEHDRAMLRTRESTSSQSERRSSKQSVSRHDSKVLSNNAYANRIITYPPVMSTKVSQEFDNYDNISVHAQARDERLRSSMAEFNEKYFMPPKTASFKDRPSDTDTRNSRHARLSSVGKREKLRLSNGDDVPVNAILRSGTRESDTELIGKSDAPQQNKSSKLRDGLLITGLSAATGATAAAIAAGRRNVSEKTDFQGKGNVNNEKSIGEPDTQPDKDLKDNQSEIKDGQLVKEYPNMGNDDDAGQTERKLSINDLITRNNLKNAKDTNEESKMNNVNPSPDQIKILKSINDRGKYDATSSAEDARYSDSRSTRSDESNFSYNKKLSQKAYDQHSKAKDQDIKADKRYYEGWDSAYRLTPGLKEDSNQGIASRLKGLCTSDQNFIKQIADDAKLSESELNEDKFKELMNSGKYTPDQLEKMYSILKKIHSSRGSHQLPDTRKEKDTKAKSNSPSNEKFLIGLAAAAGLPISQLSYKHLKELQGSGKCSPEEQKKLDAILKNQSSAEDIYRQNLTELSTGKDTLQENYDMKNMLRTRNSSDASSENVTRKSEYSPSNALQKDESVILKHYKSRLKDLRKSEETFLNDIAATEGYDNIDFEKLRKLSQSGKYTPEEIDRIRSIISKQTPYFDSSLSADQARLQNISKSPLVGASNSEQLFLKMLAEDNGVNENELTYEKLNNLALSGKYPPGKLENILKRAPVSNLTMSTSQSHVSQYSSYKPLESNNLISKSQSPYDTITVSQSRGSPFSPSSVRSKLMGQSASEDLFLKTIAKDAGLTENEVTYKSLTDLALSGKYSPEQVEKMKNILKKASQNEVSSVPQSQKSDYSYPSRSIRSTLKEPSASEDVLLTRLARNAGLTDDELTYEKMTELALSGNYSAQELEKIKAILQKAPSSSVSPSRGSEYSRYKGGIQSRLKDPTASEELLLNHLMEDAGLSKSDLTYAKLTGLALSGKYSPEQVQKIKNILKKLSPYDAQSLKSDYSYPSRSIRSNLKERSASEDIFLTKLAQKAGLAENELTSEKLTEMALSGNYSGQDLEKIKTILQKVPLEYSSSASPSRGSEYSRYTWGIRSRLKGPTPSEELLLNHLMEDAGLSENDLTYAKLTDLALSGKYSPEQVQKIKNILKKVSPYDAQSVNTYSYSSKSIRSSLKEPSASEDMLLTKQAQDAGLSENELTYEKLAELALSGKYSAQDLIKIKNVLNKASTDHPFLTFQPSNRQYPLYKLSIKYLLKDPTPSENALLQHIAQNEKLTDIQLTYERLAVLTLSNNYSPDEIKKMQHILKKVSLRDDDSMIPSVISEYSHPSRSIRSRLKEPSASEEIFLKMLASDAGLNVSELNVEKIMELASSGKYSSQDSEKMKALIRTLSPSAGSMDNTDLKSMLSKAVSFREADSSPRAFATDAMTHRFKFSKNISETLLGKQDMQPEKEQVTIQFGFKTFTDSDKNRIISTIDPTLYPDQYAGEKVTMLKTMVKMDDEEIRIPIDDAHDIAIQIKSGDRSKAYLPLNENDMDGITKTGEKLLHKSLIKIYEQELVPLQNIIKGLKEEIDSLAEQQLMLRERIYVVKRTRSMRLVPVTRRCGCMKNPCQQ